MKIEELPTPTNEHLLAEFSSNSLEVLKRRYLRKDAEGEPTETVAGMFLRVARHIAAAEGDPEADAHADADAGDAVDLFYRLLANLRFVPNSPTFTGAGTPLGQLAACFVLPIQDDMGRTAGGIFQSLRDAALIQQTGGGNGFSFSRLRPKDSLVVSSMGRATGPVGFLRVYDKAFGEIAQGGTRRGANMAVLRVDHPDIEEFVTCKTSEHAITNFNISVGVLDAFMDAVERDAEWDLHFPDIQNAAYRDFSGAFEDAEKQGLALKPYRTLRARALFDQIVAQAWRNGEPGMLFLDTAQEDHPIPYLGRYETTNPCGEQFLMPYENCCLGSVNLARHFGFTSTESPSLDWESLAATIHTSVRFLDDVVSVNAYVPAVPQLKEAAHQARRIGLGILGFADLLYRMRIRYGSAEAQELAAQVMEFMRYHAMLASIDLAQERGPFPAIKGSVYDPEAMTWRPRPWPEWLGGGPTHDWGRPVLDWDQLLDKLRQHGIRNSTQLTIAPTGTISTISGVEGYGCEPVFALAYSRYVQEADQKLQLLVVSPMFEQALIEAGLDEDAREAILQQVQATGSCQGIIQVPQGIQDTFVVSADIAAEGHVRMQAAFQLYVDASISKTVNFPADATATDIADAFRLAWKLGCKGLTVYVAGSREQEVLETAATRQEKDAGLTREVPRPCPDEHIRPRPKSLAGVTYQAQTPLGTAYVTINTNGHDQPFEVFLNVGKAGSDTAAVAEAIGRLISLTLRLPSPMDPRERLVEIAAQLSGIGGGRPMGFGHNRVLSLPDGIANVLENYLRATEEDPEHAPGRGQHPEPSQPSLALFQIGDLCPACGQAALVSTEGCQRCYACGHSAC